MISASCFVNILIKITEMKDPVDPVSFLPYPALEKPSVQGQKSGMRIYLPILSSKVICALFILSAVFFAVEAQAFNNSYFYDSYEDNSGRAVFPRYHTAEELKTELESLVLAFPEISRIETAGLSTFGRELIWLKISDNINSQEDEPEVHYIGTMHGDEPVGQEILLALIEYILNNYGIDGRVTDLVNETEIWIMPLMNPDGLTSGSRYTANVVDLNRNFPDPVLAQVGLVREPETKAIMDWASDHSPVLAANFHSGALVVNYPWDGVDPDNPGRLSPDHDLFIHLSRTYADQNPAILNSGFPDGISLGYEWYSIYGGMQDWAYDTYGIKEVTIEISTIKKPPVSDLPQIWEENRAALLAYMEEALIGVRGLVTSADTGLPLAATIWVQGNSQEVFTDPDVGDYHRLLLPGDYTLTFEAEGYEEAVMDVTVTSGTATRLDITLTPTQGAEPQPSTGGGGCFINSIR